MTCRKIFIAGTQQHSGKSTVSIALMHLARKKYDRVGYVKPIGPKVETIQGKIVDMDAVLMARVFDLGDDFDVMSPLAFHRDFTRDFLSGKISVEEIYHRVLHARDDLEKKYDFLVIEGAGHGGVGSVIGLNNAQAATLFDAPVMIITGGGIGSAIDAVQLNVALYRQERARMKMVLINRLLPDKREMSLASLRNAFSAHDIAVFGGFDYSPILANPTMEHVSALLRIPITGDPAAGRRIIHHIQLGAASAQKVIDDLRESTLLIVNNSRDELIVTLSSLYHIPAFRLRIAGLIVTGLSPVARVSQQILDDSRIPYIRYHETTAYVYGKLKDDVSKISAVDEEKIAWIKDHAERHIDFAAIDALL
jgi:BioD-like phosphotransacetylase family protein